MTRRATILPIAVAGILALGSLVGCSAVEPGLTVPTSPAASPAEVAESSNFDEGYLRIGDGADTVDIYVDALCPYCKLFETLNGDFLIGEAQAGRITLRIHPVAILDRLSAGTNYSTRAAAVLAAVAESSPDQLAAFFGALFDAQPAEGTEGLSDETLSALAVSVGAEAPSPQRLEELIEWVARSTETSRSNDLSPTAGPLTHVPMVLVNGSLFPGNSGDIDLFHRFYNEQTP